MNFRAMVSSAMCVVFTAAALTLTPPTASAAPPAALAQVPANAAAFVIVPDLTKLNGKVAKLGQALGVPGPPMADILAMVKMQLGMQKGIDDKGSLLIVMPVLDLMASDPPIVLVIPVSDFGAFVGNFADAADAADAPGLKTFRMQGEQVFAKPMGKYAVVSPLSKLVQNYKAGGDPAALAKAAGTLGGNAIDKADALLYLNMEQISPILQPLLQMGMMQMQQQFQNMPQEMEAQGMMTFMQSYMKLYGDLGNMILRDAQAVVLGLSLSDTDVQATMALQCKPETYLGKMFSKPHQPLGKLNRLPDRPVFLAGAMDMSILPMKDLAKVIKTELVDKLPDESPFKGMMAGYVKAFDAAQLVQEGQFAWYQPKGEVAGDDPTKLIDYAYIYTSTDPAGFMKANREYVQSMDAAMKGLAAMEGMPAGAEVPMKMKYTENAVQVAGRSVDKFEMEMSMPDGADVAMSTMMGFVSQMSSMYITTTDDAVVMSHSGHEETLAAALATAGGTGKLGTRPELQAAAKSLIDHRVMEAHVDLGGIMEVAVMPMLPEQMRMPIPDSPPLSMAWSATDNGTAMQLVVPVGVANQIKNVVSFYLMRAVMGAMGGMEGGGMVIEPQIDDAGDGEAPEQANAAQGPVKEVNDASFAQQVTNARGVVVVQFGAPWSTSSRKQTQPMAEAAGHYGNKVAFKSVNIDDSDKTATANNVRTIPTIIVFKDGKAVKTLTGLTDKAGIVAAVDKALGE
jgi:thioredoxin 1